MAQNPVSRSRIAALILSCVGLALAASSVRLAAQAAPEAVSASVSVDNPADALSRHLRVLANSPRNFQALIGAGQAALGLGDTQAAAGFFGRAEEVWPRSPLPQIGMGAATAQDGDPNGALAYFARAERSGGSLLAIGAHRGLAYDLLGRHAEAQADYRVALAGSEGAEARRRLALSLAITGNNDEALETLAPLLSRRDPAAIRTRALVLALKGDQTGARQAIEYSMPGGWTQMGPFLARLGGLSSSDKAAAVHLGIFPRGGAQSGPPAGSAIVAAPQVPQRQDRLAEVDALLRDSQRVQGPPAPPLSAPVGTAIAPPAAATPPPSAVTTTTAAAASASVSATQRKRFWVQLASGANAQALPSQFQRIKARSDKLLDGISGYVAEDGSRARLLVGPFRNAEDARIFAEDLETVSVSAFSWISPEGQLIRKISSE